MIFTSLILGFFIPIIPYPFFYLGTMIWSVVDIYLILEKISGKTKAIRYLIFGIITAVIIIPTIFYLTTLSFFKGVQFVKSEQLNPEYTKNEMVEICDKLDDYYLIDGNYPLDYQEFVNSKPIWSKWKRDSWRRNYRYTQSDSTNYKLTSAGNDGVFDTEDDIEMKSK